MSDTESAAAIQPAAVAPPPQPALQPEGGGGLLAIVERLANQPNPNIDVIERLLAMRNMKAVRSRYGAMTAARLKMICALGREKRAKTSPVMSAVPNMPTNASTVTIVCAATPDGLMLP